MYVLAAFLNGFDRNRKGTHIEQLCLTLFQTNIKCKRRILGSQHNNIKQRYIISQSILARKHFDCIVLVCSPVRITLLLII